MPKHVKPTSEELEENTKKVVEELEEMDEKKEEKVEEKDEEVEKEEKVEEEKKELEEEKKEEPDYKKKFVESSREAQILHAKNKKVNEALDKAISTPDPTEKQLKKEYSDWEVMSDFEKRIATESLRNREALKALGEITQDTKSSEVWNGKVDKFITDPKTLIVSPALEGREEEFRLFASKPTRRNVDFEDLTKAFLYDIEVKKPAGKKGKMFETGSGGPNDKDRSKPGEITVEEAKKLRESNYPKYKELLIAGKIKFDL